MVLLCLAHGLRRSLSPEARGNIAAGIFIGKGAAVDFAAGAQIAAYRFG